MEVVGLLVFEVLVEGTLDVDVLEVGLLDVFGVPTVEEVLSAEGASLGVSSAVSLIAAPHWSQKTAFSATLAPQLEHSFSAFASSFASPPHAANESTIEIANKTANNFFILKTPNLKDVTYPSLL